MTRAMQLLAIFAAACLLWHWLDLSEIIRLGRLGGDTAGNGTF